MILLLRFSLGEMIPASDSSRPSVRSTDRRDLSKSEWQTNPSWYRLSRFSGVWHAQRLSDILYADKSQNMAASGGIKRTLQKQITPLTAQIETVLRINARHTVISDCI